MTEDDNTLSSLGMVISHVRQSDGAIQDNQSHMVGVGERAALFASDFGMGEWGRLMGLLHDKGKERRAFQQHIKKESGLDERAVVEGDYSHAYVGALLVKKWFPKYYQLIDNPLMGHHRGLYDDGDRRKVHEAEIPPEVVVDSIDVDLALPKIGQIKDVHHLVRMLYSCLVDADYLDTEAFMLPDQSGMRGGCVAAGELEKRMVSFLDRLKADAVDTEVNRIRNEVQGYCRESSGGEPGFYSLTVPTGGGKTLASVLWAVKHLVKNGLKRVIIAIPYTSIITQTAAVLRGVFGDDLVLEHHSNADFSEQNGDIEQVRRRALATENWDYPIVVTTNVQLFESLFSNKPASCRKLHNLAKSVLILDEVQTLPRHFLQPIVDSLDTLVRVFGASVLFTTASQPVLTGRIVGCNRMVSFDGLPKIQEIVPPDARLHDRLRRVELRFDAECSDYDTIATDMAKCPRVLCVVNTRNDAREIYNRLPQEGQIFHLSRMMCPAHIKEVISQVKATLGRDSTTVVRVVSTQLVEAGVDIDFPVVFRQEAGLDSILQAAGRCNREGKLQKGETRVFRLNKPLPKGSLTDANNARLNMVGDYDWFAPEAMEAYFRQLYSRTDSFDKLGIKELLYKQEMQFESAAEAFRLIDDSTVPVIVNWKNSMDLVDRMRREGVSYGLMKVLSQFSVGVRRREMDILRGAGAIEEVAEGIYCIPDSGFYDSAVGLKVENHWIEESLIV